MPYLNQDSEISPDSPNRNALIEHMKQHSTQGNWEIGSGSIEPYVLIDDFWGELLRVLRWHEGVTHHE